MRVLIYGFDSNIANHSMKEICFFFLIYAAMIIVTGRFVEKNNITMRYMSLIRYKHISKLWRKILLHLCILSIVEVTILYIVLLLINHTSGWNLFDNGYILPFLVWCINICSICSLQLLAGIWPKGLLGSFLFVVGIEIVSLYAYPFLAKKTDILPGSYLMLSRTTAMNGCMPIGFVFAIEMGFILFVCTFGPLLYKRRNC